MHLSVVTLAGTAAGIANDPFYGYPPWLVVLVGTVAAAVLLWIFAKLLKWATWVLIVVVLAAGVVTAARMWLHR